MDEKIEICFGIHDPTGKYCKYLGVAIQSIILNTANDIGFHILHDDTLSDSCKQSIVSIIRSSQQKNNSVNFYGVNLQEYDISEIDFERFTIGTLFRLKACELLSNDINRLIYLDADIVVNLDIKQLWEEDLEGNSLAGCVPPYFFKKNIPLCVSGVVSYDEYINAGVLLVDLEKVRKESLFKQCIQYMLDHPEMCLMPDQDAINFVFRNDIKYLDWKYNTNSVIARRDKSIDTDRIYHFYGDCPRDTFECAPDKLFFDALIKTPWGMNEEIISHYEKRIKEKDKQVKTVIMLLTAIYNMPEKKVIFWGAGGAIHDDIVSLIPHGYDSYIVDKNRQKWNGTANGLRVYSPEKIEKENKQETIIISTIFRYSEVKKYLTNIGLVENVNFFDGKVLLQEFDLYYKSGERECKWDI